MTPQTETPRIRSRRDVKRCCGVSPYIFETTTVSNRQAANVNTFAAFAVARDTRTRRPCQIFLEVTKEISTRCTGHVMTETPCIPKVASYFA